MLECISVASMPTSFVCQWTQVSPSLAANPKQLAARSKAGIISRNITHQYVCSWQRRQRHIPVQPGPNSGNLGSALPCNAEHKSLVMRPWYFSRPHFPAFHLSWLAFFAAFVSTFAPAALLPVIRDNLDLTKTDLGNAGIAAVCGAIAARVAMGNFVGGCLLCNRDWPAVHTAFAPMTLPHKQPARDPPTPTQEQLTHPPDSHLCHLAPADIKGPRFGIGLCIGLTAPAVYCIGLCTSAAGFIVSRLFIGFSLATFVACQFWCTSMFNTKVVGSANALAAGWVSCLPRWHAHSLLQACSRRRQVLWTAPGALAALANSCRLTHALTSLLPRVNQTRMQGNMGGGFTHFLMPLVFDGIKSAGSPAFQVRGTCVLCRGAVPSACRCLPAACLGACTMSCSSPRVEHPVHSTL